LPGFSSFLERVFLMQLIDEKVKQSIGILKELNLDCWLTFVRETSVTGDPMLGFLSPSHLTWHSAFLVTRSGETAAIVGDMEKQGIEELGVYSQVKSYVESINPELQAVLRKLNPSSIAVNYSTSSKVSDGLSHGMYLLLWDLLKEIGYENRIVSSEPLVSRLRARKTVSEINAITSAVRETEDIFNLVREFIAPGRTEKEIAGFMSGEVARRDLEPAWDVTHCPAVFAGPDTAGAHYRPTGRVVKKGHVLNMDFGVKVEGYCSDLQRTFYILEDSETSAPPEVQKGFRVILEAIEQSRRVLKPGARGVDVDAAARNLLIAEGYEEFPHGLGHQVGRFAHDGTALLGPAWAKYSSKPFELIEAGMVFTLEPRLTVPGRGVVTVEEMVLVTEDGAEYISNPQKKLILI
jgi:Xaa-Pro aminopeptidase